jgi:hypothetical protein
MRHASPAPCIKLEVESSRREAEIDAEIDRLHKAKQDLLKAQHANNHGDNADQEACSAVRHASQENGRGAQRILARIRGAKGEKEGQGSKHRAHASEKEEGRRGAGGEEGRRRNESMLASSLPLFSRHASLGHRDRDGRNVSGGTERERSRDSRRGERRLSLDLSQRAPDSDAELWQRRCAQLEMAAMINQMNQSRLQSEKAGLQSTIEAKADVSPFTTHAHYGIVEYE